MGDANFLSQCIQSQTRSKPGLPNSIADHNRPIGVWFKNMNMLLNF